MSAVPTLLAYLTSLVISLVEGLLGLRVILKLLNASTTAPFVRWVYDTTAPLLAPFSGMFPSSELQSGLEIEFSALFALILYAFVGYVITETVEVLASASQQRKSKKKK